MHYYKTACYKSGKLNVRCVYLTSKITHQMKEISISNRGNVIFGWPGQGKFVHARIFRVGGFSYDTAYLKNILPRASLSFSMFWLLSLLRLLRNPFPQKIEPCKIFSFFKSVPFKSSNLNNYSDKYNQQISHRVLIPNKKEDTDDKFPDKHRHYFWNEIPLCLNFDQLLSFLVSFDL